VRLLPCAAVSTASDHVHYPWLSVAATDRKRWFFLSIPQPPVTVTQSRSLTALSTKAISPSDVKANAAACNLVNRV